MSKRVLTHHEERGIAVYYVCGVPLKQISALFDVSRQTISRVLKRLEVETNRKGKS